MKKLIALMLCTMMLLASAACAGVEIKTEESVTVEDLPGETDGTAPSLGGATVGGWQLSENTELTDELRAIFGKAIEGKLGVDYVPLACLGTQVVAGTNYCFLAEATVVHPDARPILTLVYVYRDLQGNASVLEFAQMPIIPNDDNTASPISAQGLMGGWAYAESIEITESIRKSFGEALNSYGYIAVYEPVANIGTQVVAGLNRCLLVRFTERIPEAQPEYKLMYVYEKLDGTAEMMNVIDFSIDMNASEPEPEYEPEPEVEPEAEPDMPVIGEMTGAWQIAENTEITDELRAIFSKAIEGKLGVDYTPLACLCTQVVAGTNYCFLAEAAVVYPDATPTYVLVYIYADLEGGAEVMNFADMPAIPNEFDGVEPIPEEETLLGGWAYTESIEITDAIRANLEKATEGLVGASYEPIANIATQVVDGTNRCLLCKITPVVPDPVPHYAFVYLYEDLEGGVELTDVYDFDFGTLCTYGA